jgi:xanthine/uracil permease
MAGGGSWSPSGAIAYSAAAVTFSQILLVLTPLVVGAVALVVGIRLLRPEEQETRRSEGRKIGAVLCVLFAAGCVLTTFALWVCVGLSRSMH